MSCNRYFEYETGSYPESLFMEHIKECSECRTALKEDQALMNTAAALKNSTVDDSGLWEKIEKDLNTVKKRQNILYLPIIRIAAAFLIVAALSSWFILRDSEPKGLFTENALAKVIETEKSYQEAIEALEKQVIPSMQKMRPELALNFRDRLATIDQQIDMCREELKNNPANIHIRKYLMAALTEKRRTLEQVRKEKIQPELRAG